MWWKTLGVKSDADMETIKKAYSALIKTYRPEEYPEQFSEIRQAFELARKQARSQTRKPSMIENQPVKPEVGNIEQAVPTDIEEVKQAPVRITIDEPEVVPQRTVELEKISPEQEESISSLLDLWKHSKYKNHQYINRVLNHPHTHDFYELKQAGHQVFAWLIENIKPASGLLATSINMPVKELARLNSLFGWSLKERDLYEQYKNYDLSLVFFGIASGQSARLHRNPIVMQKAEAKKDKYPLFEKLIAWGTGIIIVYLFIMLGAVSVAAFSKGHYFSAVVVALLFYLMIDGLYYSFAGLKKVGVLRPSMITRKSKMWALFMRQAFLGLITLMVIIALESITLYTVFKIGEAMMRDKVVALILILLPLLYITYRLNKAIFIYSRLRYFQLIKELEQIRIGSKV